MPVAVLLGAMLGALAGCRDGARPDGSCSSGIDCIDRRDVVGTGDVTDSTCDPAYETCGFDADEPDAVDPSDAGDLPDDGLDAATTDATRADARVDVVRTDATRPDAGPMRLRVMTYNIKHAELSSLTAIAAVIRAQNPDVVGLQEVDNGTRRSGGVNQSERLGSLLGMRPVFRVAMPFNGGYYGLAILTRLPIVTVDGMYSHRLFLPSSTEQRILAYVYVTLPTGQRAVIATAHLDLDADFRARQADAILRELAGKPLVILMGDFNSPPDGTVLNRLQTRYRDTWALLGQGPGYTVPAGSPRSRIDYIMADPAYSRPSSGSVPVTTASDHRPVVIQLPLPPGR